MQNLNNQLYSLYCSVFGNCFWYPRKIRPIFLALVGQWEYIPSNIIPYLSKCLVSGLAL